ncbi:MAG: transposase, partial [Cyclobacteriaceae bacterium]|nr:transposase [Cyclobacteriaceae bacterium]
RQSQNLSSIIRGFKGACTKRIHKEIDDSFQWQNRFHDHIIRDLDSLDSIRSYIQNNPANWRDDELM